MFWRRKDIKMPDSGVEGSFVRGVEKDSKEPVIQVVQAKTNVATNPKLVQQKVSPALITRLCLSLGKGLFEKIKAYGLYDEIASIVAARNMSREEITKTALELIKRKERQAEERTPQVTWSSIIDRLSKLNPNVSREDVEEALTAIMERIEKVLQLGIDTEEFCSFIQEICAAMDDVLSLHYEDQSEGKPIKDEGLAKAFPSPAMTHEPPAGTQTTPPPVQTPAEQTLAAVAQKQPEIKREPAKPDTAGKKPGEKGFTKAARMDYNVIMLEGRKVRVLRGSAPFLKKLIDSSEGYRLYSKALNKKMDRISNAPPGNYRLEIQGAAFDIHIE